MKYVIWVVRLWYAGWMTPAGLEHFYHIYPQPGYNTTNPLAHEMLFALLHSHLFDLVKAMELITGDQRLAGALLPGRAPRVLQRTALTLGESGRSMI